MAKARATTGQRRSAPSRAVATSAPVGAHRKRAETPGPRGATPATQRRQPAGKRPRRRAGARSALLIWGTIAAVVIVVAVVVALGQTGKSAPKASAGYRPEAVPASILQETTHVPASSFDKVGISGAVTPPSVVGTQPPLLIGGKPGVFVLDGEFCPYCAAERWAVVTALSRFGSFTGLKTMESSPLDVHPSTQTFEFATARYSSSYITAKLLEMYGQEQPTGRRPVIRKPTRIEARLMRKYDANSSVPFFDVGNKVMFSGSSYTPGVLAGLSRATIAAGLSHPSNPVTQLILGGANDLSASICSVDGGEPKAVCSSAGVKAAARALGLRR